MDSLLSDFWWQGLAWSYSILYIRDPTHSGKYIMNLKLTKYSQWKSSGWLVYDLGRLELTVIAGQFGLLCREANRKVSNK